MKKFILIALCLVFSLLLVSCTEEQGTKDISKIVVFDANGGKLNCDIRQRVQPGCQLELVKEPTREGYSFDGWYLGDEKWSFISDVVTIDLTLQAHWKINQYTLTLKNYYVDSDNTFSVTYGSTIEIEMPTIEGYICKNWDEIKKTTMPSHDLTLTVNWDIDYSKIHYYVPDYIGDTYELDAKYEYKNKQIDLQWISNNDNLKVYYSNNKYKIEVIRTTSVQVVELVLKIEDYERKYNITIPEFNHNDFVNKFVFDKNNDVVSSDFYLASGFTLYGNTCKITWTSSNTDLINISKDNIATVNQSSKQTKVNLTAKFIYNDVIMEKTYSVVVFKEMTETEAIEYWYTNTGITQTLSGYVLGIATVYNASYGNISLYLLDDSMQAGYYIYRGLCDAETAAKIVPGVHVTVTGGTNTCYSGFWELNGNTGTITVDEEIEAINPTSTIVDYDGQLIAKASSYIYRQSSLVKLNGWKITAKLAEPASGNSTTILTLEKNGVSIGVSASKYCESEYSVWEKDADPKFQAIIDKYNSLNVGDYVDVVGYLYAKDGDLINLYGADYLIKTSN